MVPSKKCSKCEEVKEITEFPRDARKRDGVRCHCKSCFALYMKSRYYENPQKYRKIAANWRANNIEKARESNRRYKEKNREILNAKTLERYHRNKLRYKKASDLWKKKHPNKGKEYRENQKRKNPQDPWGNKRNARKLTNSYIITLLCGHKSGLKAKDITPKLIEVKRWQIKVHKKIKKVKEGKNVSI